MGCPLHARCGSPALNWFPAPQQPMLRLISAAQRSLVHSPGRISCSSAVQTREVAPVAESAAKSVQIKNEVLPAPSAGHLANGATSYMEEHRIRAYEVGPDQKTSIVTVANLLQEVAGNHAVALWGRTEEGFATDPIMVAKSLIFAATRIQIQMDRYPKWGDLIHIETWFQAEGRVGARRDWLIRDAVTRVVLGRATSTWVMVSLKTRRVAKIPDEMRKKLEAFAPNPLREAVPAVEARHKLPPFEVPAEIVGPTQVARRSDVDMNGHINNVTYLAWALETVPRDVYHMHELQQVEIDYKAECHSGDTVESLGQPVKEETNGTGACRFVHLLQRCDESGCRDLVKARTTWRPTHD